MEDMAGLRWRWRGGRGRRGGRQALGRGGCAFLISAMDVAISEETSLMLPGTIMVLFFWASWAKASTARSATFRFTASWPPGDWMASAILRMASAVASATDVMAMASPWALLISACRSPSDLAM